MCFVRVKTPSIGTPAEEHDREQRLLACTNAYKEMQEEMAQLQARLQALQARARWCLKSYMGCWQ